MTSQRIFWFLWYIFINILLSLCVYSVFINSHIDKKISGIFFIIFANFRFFFEDLKINLSIIGFFRNVLWSINLPLFIYYYLSPSRFSSDARVVNLSFSATGRITQLASVTWMMNSGWVISSTHTYVNTTQCHTQTPVKVYCSHLPKWHISLFPK